MAEIIDIPTGEVPPDRPWVVVERAPTGRSADERLISLHADGRTYFVTPVKDWGAAILGKLIVDLSVGEAKEVFADDPPKNEAAAALGRMGGAARAKAITPERRAEIARKAAQKRWRKP